MPSNALSQKSFSTKTPVICKPPPWPPFVPPPPLPKAVFHVYGNIQFDHPRYPVSFAAACSANYDPATHAWIGKSSNDPASQYIGVVLWPEPLTPVYNLKIVFHWPPDQARTHQWFDKVFSTDRPYVGSFLTFKHAYTTERANAIAREKPG